MLTIMKVKTIISMSNKVISRQEKGGIGMGDLVDPKGLAEALSIPLSQVYRLTQKGELPHLRVGKYIRYNPQEVLDKLHT
jgi:excisionase family DNA binding protein